MKAVNWNTIGDMVDKMTWEKLTSQFWLDTRIPVSNDLDDWRKLSQKERDLVAKVFGGLTLLDTLQSYDATQRLLKDAKSEHEKAIYTNISFMESVHAKSYSTIFSTLNTKSEIEEIFNWVETNPHLQKKVELIKEAYYGDNPHKAKIASVLLESALFYSGFYTPLYYLGTNRLPNVAEIIRLIIRDECLTRDHEVFTHDGWVSIADVRPGDCILTYDSTTRENIFDEVTSISQHLVPSTYQLDGNDETFIKGSANHRVLTYNEKSEPKVYTLEELSNLDVTAYIPLGGYLEELNTLKVSIENKPTTVYGISVPSGFILVKHNDVESITGNSVHGTYIGYKFQKEYDKLSQEEKDELKNYTYELAYKLYKNEELYTNELYDSVGWTEDVKKFVRYNFNKALHNLGFDALFPETEEDVNPVVMNGLSTGTANHDFFSQVGNGYLLLDVEPMEDDDYNVI